MPYRKYDGSKGKFRTVRRHNSPTGVNAEKNKVLQTKISDKTFLFY
jgi:hypothetical protein